MDHAGDEDGYAGPAELAIGAQKFDVLLELRGQFQPIDGRYHWYGRVSHHDGIDTLLAGGRAAGTVSTPHGQAPCELSDPDAWGRYRITGFSAPPFTAAVRERV
jgi:Domain of unknown function (DUF4873)